MLHKCYLDFYERCLLLTYYSNGYLCRSTCNTTVTVYITVGYVTAIITSSNFLNVMNAEPPPFLLYSNQNHYTAMSNCALVSWLWLPYL